MSGRIHELTVTFDKNEAGNRGVTTSAIRRDRYKLPPSMFFNKILWSPQHSKESQWMKIQMSKTLLRVLLPCRLNRDIKYEVKHCCNSKLFLYKIPMRIFCNNFSQGVMFSSSSFVCQQFTSVFIYPPLPEKVRQTNLIRINVSVCESKRSRNGSTYDVHGVAFSPWRLLLHDYSHFECHFYRRMGERRKIKNYCMFAVLR